MPSSWPRNQWYVAGSMAELGERPIGRTVLGEPLVFFRDSRGAAHALTDRCPHRKYPLSPGKVVGDDIQCGYHGLQFDGQGRCTFAPSQPDNTPNLKVQSYPLVERHARLWIWMGEPALADPAKIPDFHWQDDVPEWKAVYGYHYVKGAYQLITDNLVELTHLPLIHPTTLAGPGIFEAPLHVEMKDGMVRGTRYMPNVDPPPLFVAVGGFAGKIDRRQITDFIMPCHVLVWVGARDAGSDADLDVPLHLVTHSVTPETETTSHYFWSVSRRHKLDDEALTQRFYDLTKMAFDEDASAIELQQARIDTDPDGGRLVNLACDKAAALSRQLVSRAIAAELGAAEGPIAAE